MRVSSASSSLLSQKLRSSCLRRWNSRCGQSLRNCSTSPILLPTHESKVNVSVGLSGQISLSISQPPKPSFNGPIIIYLPRGPLETPTSNAPSSLAMSSNAVVVRIDYRLSAQQPYPIAVHDVLAGYDWIKKYLGGIASMSDGVSNPIMQRKLGVCGELLGGSLASMLALTECHADKQSISVAALGNPITDWTAFFPEAQDINPANTTPAKVDGSAAKRSNPFLRISSTHESPTTEDLLALRDKMFRQPAHFFDPFASPALYFRTPSFDLPTEIPASIARYLTPSSSSSERESPQPLVRKRRSHRKYPPLSSGLRLPKMRIELGNDGVLKEQGLELVELMRRSVDMWEDDERSSTMNQKETERIQPIMRQGSGLWGELEMNQIGLWFAEAFC